VSNQSIQRIISNCYNLQSISLCFLPLIDDAAFDTLWRQEGPEVLGDNDPDQEVLFSPSFTNHLSFSLTILQSQRWYRAGGRQLRSVSIWFNSNITDRTAQVQVLMSIHSESLLTVMIPQRIGWSCKKLKTFGKSL